MDPSDRHEPSGLGRGGAAGPPTEVELTPLDPGPPAPPGAGWTLGRKHVAMAVAALVAGAVFISRADGGPSAAASELRTTEFAGPELTDEDEEVTVAELDERTLKIRERRDNARRSATDPGERATVKADTFDDDVTFDDTFPEDELALDDEFADDFDDDFDDEFDDEFDDDFDSFSTLPRRNSSSGRVTSPQPSRTTTRATVATTTTSTTVADTTTTTIADTTTTSTTTTSSTTTSTTLPPPPPPVWVPATSGLAVDCGEALRIWSRPGGLLASIAGEGLFSWLDSTATWTPLPATDVGTGEMRVLVQDPASARNFWIAGADGVFQTTDGGQDFDELGDHADVHALSVGLSTPGPDTILAVVGASRTLQRSVDDGATWTAVQLPAGAGHPLVLNGTSALLGTSTGVYASVNGGATWSLVPDSSGVAGVPVRATDGTLFWLLGDGSGVIRSTDAGATWPRAVANGPISQLPDGRLVRVGGANDLTVSGDGGLTWVPFGPACPSTRPG